MARRSQRRPAPGVEACAAAYTAYEQLKRRRGVIDFDDVLAHTIRELEYSTDFADALRWRFRHVLVDEAQDLNPLQHRLVDLLRAGRDDLFLVGDPAQAIYGFNGADPTLLVDVETRFAGIEVIRLPVNHRCTPQIVQAGLHVLDVSGQPTTLASSRGDGPAAIDLTATDETDEARLIAGLVAAGDPTLVRTGEIGVLVRTNAQIAPITDALAAAGVPVRRSTSAFGSPIQAVVRQVAALGSASQLRAWAHDTLDAAPSLHSARDDGAADIERRVAGATLDFLREIPLGDGAGFRAWVATTNPFDDGSPGGVEVLTFHASKGREWHTVVVAGVESNLVPHRSATTAAGREEEGRLLYVAITRATDRLVIAHAARRGGYARTPSPFIEGLATGEPDARSPAAAPSPCPHRPDAGDPHRLARAVGPPTRRPADRVVHRPRPRGDRPPSPDDRRRTGRRHLVRPDDRGTHRRTTRPGLPIRPVRFVRMSAGDRRRRTFSSVTCRGPRSRAHGRSATCPCVRCGR